MARSLNKVQLIGNLTRDPELRYTPNGNAVCSFSIATNRNWTTDSGEKREEVDFHRIVAWNKLAEICSQYLTKGQKTYVEGRLSTRNWTGQDGTQKTTTEVVIDDMILLGAKGQGSAPSGEGYSERSDVKKTPVEPAAQEEQVEEKVDKENQVEEVVEKEESKKSGKSKKEEKDTDEVVPDDIPF